MKFSERWLREWVDPPLSTDELAARLTGAGLEVDSVQPVGDAHAKVVVAEVVEVSRHPDADRLSLCRVDVGTGEPISVVCGAPNVRPGMRAALALPGARLPGGLKVRRSKIRGEESKGMLCSARELGLGTEQDSIVELGRDAAPGRALRDELELDDVTIDIELTPNRGDCLGMEGIAREVGALTGDPVVGAFVRAGEGGSRGCRVHTAGCAGRLPALRRARHQGHRCGRRDSAVAAGAPATIGSAQRLAGGGRHKLRHARAGAADARVRFGPALAPGAGAARVRGRGPDAVGRDCTGARRSGSRHCRRRRGHCAGRHNGRFAKRRLS